MGAASVPAGGGSVVSSRPGMPPRLFPSVPARLCARFAGSCGDGPVRHAELPAPAGKRGAGTDQPPAAAPGHTGLVGPTCELSLGHGRGGGPCHSYQSAIRALAAAALVDGV